MMSIEASILPFLLQSETENRRWSRVYRSRIIGGDLLNLENFQDMGTLERMVLPLPDLVGSPLSLNALREDLQVAHQTVSCWFLMLENLYTLFRVYPFGAPQIRALKKGTAPVPDPTGNNQIFEENS